MLKQKLKAELTEKAEGTFLWVSLACRRLESVCREKALITIQTLPPGLYPLYDRIFRQLTEGERVEVQRCMRLLKVMMLAYRPLKVEEVSSVTGLTDEEDAIRATVDRCASFIKMPENIIQFVHQSARDYLAGENGQSILDLHDDFGHGEIALSCLFHLSELLKPNLLELQRPNSTRESLKMLEHGKKSGLLASMDYAATFWVQHLENSAHIADKGAVSTFLCTKLLEWLECLSLLDKLPQAIKALQALAKSEKDNYLALAFVKDATRFLLRHYHIISNWPLQIYSSAIIFSPESSIMKRENLKKIPGWFRNLPPMEENWASLVQTLTGHSGPVNAVAFSPDGKQIASGSHDKAIKVWDTTTGDCQKTMTGHSRWVNAVMFSSNGTQIATGSDDDTIKIWDTKTGDCQRTLAGHSNPVTAVVFSPDGKKIASGSEDHTIKLWDVTTGNCQNTLTGHSHQVATVDFSPDGKQIVSGSEDHTIKVWDVTTGNCQKTLPSQPFQVAAVAFSPNGKRISCSSDKVIWIWDAMLSVRQRRLVSHSGSVNTLAFSPDGKQIASGSEDHTIKLWRATTGDCQKTLTGHSRRVNAVAFSPDSKQIASGSHDETIKLWDVMAGGRQRRLASHSASVTTVAFSPDGKQIVSASLDKTIKLWDATLGHCQKTLAGHSRWVNTVAFSPDGKQIASSSSDKTIKLWDATLGDCQKTLAGHSRWVNTVAFSPDGKQIASGSSDKTIKLWDTTLGDCKKTLAGHSGSVNTVAFSPDGKQIASGSSDKTIKVWDATLGDCLKTLAGHSGSVNTVAFSPDGEQIASASSDKTIKLWDIGKHLKALKYVGHTFASFLNSASSQEIKTPEVIHTIRFSEDSQYLTTNIGTIKLVDPADWQINTFGTVQDIYVRDQWICYGDMPLVRLPSDFIPACADAQGDELTIGFRNGQVLSFNIDRSSLQSMTGDHSSRY